MCGRANPGLFGFGPALRQFSLNFGFAQLVVGACVTLWLVTLLVSGGGLSGGGSLLSALSPSNQVLFVFGASGAVPVFAAGRWWTRAQRRLAARRAAARGDEHVLGLADGPGHYGPVRPVAHRDHLHGRRRASDSR